MRLSWNDETLESKAGCSDFFYLIRKVAFECRRMLTLRMDRGNM